MKVALRRLPTLVACRWLDLWLIAILAVGSFGAILRIGLLPAQPGAGSRSVYAPWDDGRSDNDAERSVPAARFCARLGGILILSPSSCRTAGLRLKGVLADSALLAVDPQVLAGCLPASFLKKADAL